MKTKKGGGKHQQAFDERTGRYVKSDYSKENNTILRLSLLNEFEIENADLRSFFPVLGANDGYCKFFVSVCKTRITFKNISEEKIIYLLTKAEKNDKSKYLNQIGYNIDDKDALLNDILAFTDFNTLCFRNLTQYSLNCQAKTVLHGHIVTTGWRLTEDFELKFVTLIPKGEKKWK